MPASGRGFEAGQGRCETCGVWIDCRGAHTGDCLPATDDSRVWFCNCCNRRVRRRPRTKIPLHPVFRRLSRRVLKHAKDIRCE